MEANVENPPLLAFPVAGAPGSGPATPSPEMARAEMEASKLAAEAGAGTAGTESSPEGQSPALGAGRPFDEAGTKAGVTILVDMADQGAVEHFTGKAEPIVGAADAQRFGKSVALAPNVKTSIVNSSVEICRKHNINIGPEWTLGAALIFWAKSLASASKELGSLAVAKKEASK
jgi:hypothetical protein